MLGKILDTRTVKGYTRVRFDPPVTAYEYATMVKYHFHGADAEARAKAFQAAQGGTYKLEGNGARHVVKLLK